MLDVILQKIVILMLNVCIKVDPIGEKNALKFLTSSPKILAGTATGSSFAPIFFLPFPHSFGINLY